MQFEFIFMNSADINCVDQLVEINYYQNIFTVLTSAEATTLNEKIHKLTLAKEKNTEFIFGFQNFDLHNLGLTENNS